jgi:WhiB family redox-sensing transcriptional regulator
MTSSFDTLIAQLAGAPALHGARCRGRSHLFDARADREPLPVAEARHAQALGLCARCPALVRCKSWLDDLPVRKRPLGVVAGRVNQ